MIIASNFVKKRNNSLFHCIKAACPLYYHSGIRNSIYSTKYFYSEISIDICCSYGYYDIAPYEPGGMFVLLQQLVNGLMLGSVYSLIALGYSMVYGVLGFINFAHGDIFMWGAFFGLLLARLGLPFPIILVLVPVFSAVLGMAVERIAYKPLRKASRLVLTSSALGMSIFLSNLARLVIGSATYPIPKLIQNEVYSIGGAVQINKMQIIVFATAIVLMVFLNLFIKKSSRGKAMRAVAENSMVAGLMGINFDRVVSLTFAIGSAAGGIAGFLVGMYYDAVYFSMGYSAGIKAFSAAILGGIGSIPGAMVGGIALGLIENLGVAYLSSGWRDAICFIVLLLILMIRPSGIFNANIYDKKA